MPRRPRLAMPNVPLHLIQRGNNRQACFFAAEDYLRYLEWLEEYAASYACRIHAWVLMTNHVHLLLSAEDAAAPGAMMKALGQRYVQYVNRVYRRSGTLWEGRYRSCLAQDDAYLLSCQRYIELNPVRAGMVEHPAEVNRGQTTVFRCVLVDCSFWCGAVALHPDATISAWPRQSSALVRFDFSFSRGKSSVFMSTFRTLMARRSSGLNRLLNLL